MERLSRMNIFSSNVKYLFAINISYMCSVIDLNDGRRNSMQGLVCAMLAVRINQQINVLNVQLITAMNM